MCDTLSYSIQALKILLKKCKCGLYAKVNLHEPQLQFISDARRFNNTINALQVLQHVLYGGIISFVNNYLKRTS